MTRRGLRYHLRPDRPASILVELLRRETSMSTKEYPGLASIIVPCFNQREFTRSCLQSLFRYTRAPWEAIVVDNGSTDDTKPYLAGVQDATAVPVTVVANATNLGFPAAINQGLQLARGEYLVLLNNDVVVTDGWLDQLTALTTAKTGPTAESAREEKEGKARIDFTAETAEIAETKTGGPVLQENRAGVGSDVVCCF